MIAWARYKGRSGRGSKFHAFDATTKKPSGWYQSLCGKWAKDEILAKDEQVGKKCRDCATVADDTGKFSKWGAGR